MCSSKNKMFEPFEVSNYSSLFRIIDMTFIQIQKRKTSPGSDFGMDLSLTILNQAC